MEKEMLTKETTNVTELDELFDMEIVDVAFTCTEARGGRY